MRRTEGVHAAVVATPNQDNKNNKNHHLPLSLEPNDEDEAIPSNQGAVKAKNNGLRDVVEALIPYTERPLTRTECMVQDSYVLDFFIGEMDRGVVLNEEGMVVDPF